MTVSILVVEDQAELRDALKVLLEGEGYEVHCAGSPDDALELLNHLPRPCILLWDALTPRQGWSLLHQARLDGVHIATLPVSVASVRAPGAERTLAKRLTSEEAILRIVREYCPLADAANA
jgi:CheY-like chemotaxis protein